MNAYIVNNINGTKIKTDRVVIKYPNKGYHVFPDYPKRKWKKGWKK